MAYKSCFSFEDFGLYHVSEGIEGMIFSDLSMGLPSLQLSLPSDRSRDGERHGWDSGVPRQTFPPDRFRGQESPLFFFCINVKVSLLLSFLSLE